MVEDRPRSFLAKRQGYPLHVVTRASRAAFRAGRGTLAWVAVAVVLYAVWLLLVDTREEPQLLLGVGVAALGATGSELVRRQRDAGFGFRLGWLRRFWQPLANVPADLVRLAALALRGPRPGRLRALPFEPAGDDPADLGRVALAEFAGSFSPNTYVIGVDEERRVLLAHQLIPKEERPERDLDPLGLR